MRSGSICRTFINTEPLIRSKLVLILTYSHLGKKTKTWWICSLILGNFRFQPIPKWKSVLSGLGLWPDFFQTKASIFIRFLLFPASHARTSSSDQVSRPVWLAISSLNKLLSRYGGNYSVVTVIRKYFSKLFRLLRNSAGAKWKRSQTEKVQYQL